VCLLIALFRVVDDAPLIIAANRDELYARPTVTMTVLHDGFGGHPRVLGGRDEQAGGTWLAVNEHGVVAGLTNQPADSGRDPSKKSRGELPLAFTGYRTAAEAVAAETPKLKPSDYNPCWLLVGDRDTLFSVGLAGGTQPDVTQLPPGAHVLENRPLGTPTAKTAQVTAMIAAERARHAAAPPETETGTENAATAAAALAAVLSDHRPAVENPPAAPPAPGATGRVRPPELSAACVHTPTYGTRSAMIVTVPVSGLPGLRVADGSPCEVPFADVTGLWARTAQRPGQDGDPARR
jgi:uncharacterized protein with NRDE domain